MKTKIKLIIIAIFLLLTGCSDTVTEKYSTRNEAEQNKIFERGWLPSIIPKSSTQIRTTNDLDINTSSGEFKYDSKDTAEFMTNLMQYSGRKAPFQNWDSYINDQKKDGYIPYEYSNNQSVWIFFINQQKGQIKYNMWLLRKDS